MVKKRSGGAARFKASKVTSTATDNAAQRSGPAPPAHIQRKVARKVQFLDRIAASKAKALAATSTVQTKRRRNKKALPSLKTLADSLGDVLSTLEQTREAKQQEQQQQQRVVSAKGRMHTAARESARLKLVLKSQHFNSNPILAITGHINSVLPPPPARSKHTEKKRQGKKKSRTKLTIADSNDMPIE